ncbi:MAG: aspartate kinase, partial [Chloroflexota bacterium]|nr:aspartate kinase [Chloroflexota bacterium]
EMVSSTLLAMALGNLGCQAVSLSGAQAGIRTDAGYRRARILSVDPRRVLAEMDKGKIVIVAGFQGIATDKDITTLGRGGSDTTAVALAASLQAENCQIYTDVAGVYTADPRVVPEALQVKWIGYEEMLELSSQGARVIHSRAVELAELYNMPVIVASSDGDIPGTLISKEEAVMEATNRVRGIAQEAKVVKITAVGVPDQPGIAATIFEPLVKANISVDTIVQNTSIEGVTDLSFTVEQEDEAKARAIVEPVAMGIGAERCISEARLAKISIVGTGMQNTPGFAAKMFRTLSEQGINIRMITTSEIRITCIVSENRVDDATRALHKAFVLDRGEP